MTTDESLSEPERKLLYASLLRGIGNVAQDRLCAADENHAWGEWTRYRLVKDLPIRAPTRNYSNTRNETYQTRSERHYLNCGKVQHA